MALTPEETRQDRVRIALEDAVWVALQMGISQTEIRNIVEQILEADDY